MDRKYNVSILSLTLPLRGPDLSPMLDSVYLSVSFWEGFSEDSHDRPLSVSSPWHL